MDVRMVKKSPGTKRFPPQELLLPVVLLSRTANTPRPFSGVRDWAVLAWLYAQADIRGQTFGCLSQQIRSGLRPDGDVTPLCAVVNKKKGCEFREPIPALMTAAAQDPTHAGPDRLHPPPLNSPLSHSTTAFELLSQKQQQL